MVKYTQALNATFAALADPTRRAILVRLSRGNASVTDLAKPFKVSLPAISKHLRVLERAGLLTQVRDGRTRLCGLRAMPMRAAAVWIERYRRFWTGKLDALTAFAEEFDTDHSRSEHPQSDPKGQSP